MPIPTHPKIYHITHIDRLASIIAVQALICDAELISRRIGGTTIGLSSIKQRRLEELRLRSYPDLFVGQCVPFYFCPRSVMLFKIHRGNDTELPYRLGQDEILHLEADLRESEIDWNAVEATDWRQCKEGKQAEFLIERQFPWQLVSRIGVKNAVIQQRVTNLLSGVSNRPSVEVLANWYY